jgi:hypothetical protein
MATRLTKKDKEWCAHFRALDFWEIQKNKGNPEADKKIQEIKELIANL